MLVDTSQVDVDILALRTGNICLINAGQTAIEVISELFDEQLIFVNLQKTREINFTHFNSGVLLLLVHEIMHVYMI